mgnify:CR=1 FL=1
MKQNNDQEVDSCYDFENKQKVENIQSKSSRHVPFGRLSRDTTTAKDCRIEQNADPMGKTADSGLHSSFLVLVTSIVNVVGKRNNS